MRHGRGSLTEPLAPGRTGYDPWAGGFRRILSVLQTALSVGIVLGVVGPLLAASPGRPAAPATAGGPPAFTLIVPLETDPAASSEARRATWEAVAERARRVPTLSAESLSTPGAWSGLGRVDVVVAECGACVRGGLPVPLLGEEARHLVVSPGFFAQAGLEVTSGRRFASADGPDSPRVALVSRSFALRNFEDGDPLGHGIRVGGPPGSWHTVVGVVEEPPGVALGRVSGREPTIYLALAQHPPDRAELALTFEDAPEDAPPPPSLADVVGAVEAVPAGVPETLDRRRRRDAAPVRWAGRWAAVVGLLALGTALGGAGSVARIEARARRLEMTVRAALGATPAELVGRAVARTLRATGLGVVLSVPVAVAVGGAFRAVAGSLPLPDVRAWALLGAGVLLAAGFGALGPAREAAGVDPARGLVGE